MIETMIGIPTLMIPENSIVISWYHLKLISGGCFSIGAVVGFIIAHSRKNIEKFPEISGGSA